MGTGGHLIEATVLIVGFMRTPSVFFSLLNNLSPRQLLNQALSLLSCHKEARRRGCRARGGCMHKHTRIHTHTHTHAYSHTLIHTRVFKHVFTHVFTRTFICTHTPAHTHTYSQSHEHYSLSYTLLKHNAKCTLINNNNEESRRIT